jgi:PhnB protein
MATSTPAGWHSVTPRLVVTNPAKMVQFLRDTFEATGALVEHGPAQMRIGDSIVMVSGTGPRDARSAFLYVYVDDVDATYARALEAGALSVEPPQVVPYGDRRAMVTDPWGNDWQIATYLGPPD